MIDMMIIPRTIPTNPPMTYSIAGIANVSKQLLTVSPPQKFHRPVLADLLQGADPAFGGRHDT